MKAESSQEEELLNQPLPSMDIPLLRQERRSHRIRQITIVSFALIIGGATLWGLLFWGKNNDFFDLSAEPIPNTASNIFTQDAENGATVSAKTEIDIQNTEQLFQKDISAHPQNALSVKLAENGVDENLHGEIGTLAPTQKTPLQTVLKERNENQDLDLPIQAHSTSSTNGDHEEKRPLSTRLENKKSAHNKTSDTSEFGDAKSFRQALQSIGLSSSECQTLENALGKVMNFRHCQPTDKLEVFRTKNGTLEKFEYHFNEISFVRAIRETNGKFSAQKMEATLERKTTIQTGTVNDSLGKAILSAGLGHTTVNLFLEVFAGHIDFSRDVRENDRFQIIIDEKYLNGEKKGYGKAHALSYQGSKAGKKNAYWYESKKARAAYYDETGRELQGGWMKYPLRYERVSSPFDPRRKHPILKTIMPHHGVDFAASTGTPVRACANGKVTFADYKGPNGNLVIVDHGSGYTSHYAHLHRISRGIRKGVQVKQGRLMGVVGTTGRSTGPHLHFGLKKRGKWIDPVPELNSKGRPLPAAELSKFQKKIRTWKKMLETGTPETET